MRAQKTNQNFLKQKITIPLQKKSHKRQQGKSQTNSKDKHYTQDTLPIHDIQYGIIITTDKRYIKILEILPVNFYDKPDETRDLISEQFTDLYRSSIKKVQLKIIVDKANPTAKINHLMTFYNKEKDEKRKARLLDEINLIKATATEKALMKRFFYVLEYHGDANGNKSTNIYTIAQTMQQEATYIEKTLTNAIVFSEDPNTHSGEILYMLLNRRTSRTESLQERITKINNDYTLYNIKHGTNKKPCVRDYLASHGLCFKNPEYHTEDGLYYSYAVLNGDTYPARVYAGWLNIFQNEYEDHVDIDIFIEKVPKEIAANSLKQYTKFQEIFMNIIRDPSSIKSIRNKLASNTDILDSINTGQDIFYVQILFTFKANSLNELMTVKALFKKMISNKNLKIEESLYDTKECYCAALPLLNNKIHLLKSNKHNYITDELGGLYNITAHQLYDPEGVFLGTHYSNFSLVITNIFNTTLYSNGNMLFAGTPGMGKTYALQTFGTRLSLQGIRVNFIIPQKGYEEYRAGCYAMNGSFIQLGPGYETCVNIMQLYPEDNSESLIHTNANAKQKKSLLAKKIVSITTFTQLLMGKDEMTLDEENELNLVIKETYNYFGINDDNNSIFEEDGSLKEMPIISHLVSTMSSHPYMDRIMNVYKPFISGNCQNMNGQTNVDITNHYTVWDVDYEVIPAKLFPAFMFVAVDTVYNLAKSSRLVFDAAILDEVWRMIINKACAELVNEIIRIFRGYAGAVILGTQGIREFLSAPEGFGETALSDTKIKLFFGMEKQEIDRISKVIEISPEDQNKILSFKRGRALMYANNERIIFDILGSEMDTKSFTTDPNLIQKMAQENIQAASII